MGFSERNLTKDINQYNAFKGGSVVNENSAKAVVGIDRFSSIAEKTIKDYFNQKELLAENIQ